MLPKLKPYLPFIVGGFFGLISVPIGISIFSTTSGGSNLQMPSVYVLFASIRLGELLKIREIMPDLEIVLTFVVFPAVISGTVFQIAYLIIREVIKRIRGKK